MKWVKFKLEFEIDDVEQKVIVDRLFNNPLGDNRTLLRLKLDELVISDVRHDTLTPDQLDVVLQPNGKLQFIEEVEHEP